MRYHANHIRRLRDEAQTRCNTLLTILNVPLAFEDNYITVDGSRIRIAVDDFKSILTEIRRLK